jgi:uncharacterized protein YjaG (DUF416 family)
MTESLTSSICKLADAMVMSEILTSVARKRSFPKASSNITKHLKEMEDAINDLEEQTPKAVAYERCVTAIMLIPEMLGEKSDGMIRVYDVSFKTI